MQKIATLSLMHFFVLCAITLFNPQAVSPDEAYYWLWSKNLDWAYFSKGPLIAFMINISTSLYGDNAFAVRFPAIFCFELFVVGLYLFSKKILNEESAYKIWQIVATGVIFLQSGLLMTTDSAALVSWLGALWSAHNAIIENKNKSWLFFGVFLGLGIWAKYTVILLFPGVLLFLVVNRKLKQHLQGIIFSSFVFLLFCLPIIYWNYKHDWINFNHNIGHLTGEESLKLRLKFLFELILAQLGLVGPIILPLIFISAVKILIQKKNDRARFFILTSLPLFFIVFIVSMFRRVYVNWPLPMYVGMLIGLGWYFHELVTEEEKKLFRKGIILNSIVSLIAIIMLFGFTFGLNKNMLPTKKVFGWQKLAESIDKLKQDYASDNLIILSDHYGVASELSFYMKGQPFVYCINLGNRRVNQFDIWMPEEKWEKLEGQDALLVLKGEAPKIEPKGLFEEFTHIVDYEGDGKGVISGNLKVFYGKNLKLSAKNH